MKRNDPKPDLIITGDWHLRETIPICRTDDFRQAQWDKVLFVYNLQIKYDCPVIHSGDLFDHWKPSPYLLSATIQNIPTDFLTIYGNHDLPQHSLELADKSGVNVLHVAKALIVLPGNHWGEDFIKPFYTPLSKLIGIWHVMTYQGKTPWPRCTDLSAKQILEKYPEYDLIITGHNHKSFVEKLDGRLLINPGSLTRQTADQIDHEPCVYLWFAKDNSCQKVLLPFSKGVISREHIEKETARNDRLLAFIEKLNQEFDPDISFEDNLEKMIKISAVRKSVVQIIRKALE